MRREADQLLSEIQEQLLSASPDLAPTLLRLRLLAARIENTELADWVRFESEGYPPEVELPEYRQLDVYYTGTFLGSFGAAIRNAPIPPFLIEKFAEAKWLKLSM